MVVNNGENQLIHSLLARQIRKFLKDEHLEDASLIKFINAINDSYLNYERDKDLFEHASLLNEGEYNRINTRLKAEIEQRRQSFQKLIEAASSLEVPEGFDLPDFKEENVLELVDFLKKQIIYQKQIEEELIQAKIAAEAATRAKSEFLSIMSHEIRTPLNAILGIVYLLKQENIPQALAENINTLQFSANNLYVLINDLLDFSKIEAGKVELERSDFDFHNLLNQIQTSYQAKAAERNNIIRLQIDNKIPEILIGDSLRISQIITNLVSNAVKFTEKGRILIEASLVHQEGQMATIKISIKDNGIGISAEDQRKIFKQFSQATTSTTRRYGGTGLGLVICNGLLSLYSSSLELESELGVGSHFFFVISLPIGQKTVSSNKHTRRNTPVEMTLEGVKLLLVEDYVFNIKVAANFFKRWKIEFDVAENGLEAVKMSKEKYYDVILMDIQMPVMDGYEATTEIRKFNTEIPILALTASATIDDKYKSLEVQMDDYLTKPFNPKDLFQKIAKYSGREVDY